MRHQFQIPYLCLMPCFLPPAAMMHAHAGDGMGRGSINIVNLPLDKDCRPVYPHQFNRAKVIFEVSASSPASLSGTSPAHAVVPLLLSLAQQPWLLSTQVAKEHGMKTAWTDKHPAYDILNGPSGTGIDQLFTPEINLVGEDYTTNPASCMRYDTHHVNAIVNWWVQLNPFDL